MSQALSLAEIPHLLVESDYEVYSAARAAGLPVLYGDASRVGTLRAAGAERARVVAITFHRPEPALRIARWLRHHHPSVSLLATSLTDREAGQLLALPGVRVYLERLAAGLTLAEEALVQSGLSTETAGALIGELRQRYNRNLYNPRGETMRETRFRTSDTLHDGWRVMSCDDLSEQVIAPGVVYWLLRERVYRPGSTQPSHP